MGTFKTRTIHPLTQKDIDRFWSKVDVRGPDECWPWKDALDDDGYGRFYIYPSQQFLSHRVAFYIHNGYDPAPLLVRHKCDYPPCHNPAHLLDGTHKDNSMDALERGRAATGLRSGVHTHPERFINAQQNSYFRLHPEAVRGENSPVAKLTEKQVHEIRALYTPTYGIFKSIAMEYGVSAQNISSIVKRKAWAWLKDKRGRTVTPNIRLPNIRRPLFTGELNGNSKLTEDQISDIRLRHTWKRGDAGRLAKEFGVSLSTIYRIRDNEAWVSKHHPNRRPKHVHKLAKVKPETISKMKALRRSGVSVIEVAKRFHINVGTVSRLANTYHLRTSSRGKQ